MAIRVVVSRAGNGEQATTEDHERGRFVQVSSDGHLLVLEAESASTSLHDMHNVVAVYAPGKWASVEVLKG